MSLIQTIHTQGCAEGQPLSIQLSNPVDIMTPLIHKNDSSMPPNHMIFDMGEDAKRKTIGINQTPVLIGVAGFFLISVAASSPNRGMSIPGMLHV